MLDGEGMKMQNSASWKRLRYLVLGVATMAAVSLSLANKAGAEDGAPSPKERQSQTIDSSRRLNRAEDMIAVLREGNRMEIEGAKLALEKGQAERVKNFARLLTSEHQRCDQQLLDYATQKGVDQRTFADGTQQPTDGPLDRLRVRQSQNFDRAFILAMVREHGKMIDALTSTMQESHDADLRRLLAGQLPVLEKLKKAGEAILAGLPANSEN
jgi:putative membrane protein